MRIALLFFCMILMAASLHAQHGYQSSATTIQPVQVTKTDQFDFAPGGVLRMVHSIGDIEIEAWDNARIEITTIKGTAGWYAEGEGAKGAAELDQVTVATERRGNELLVTTNSPRHRTLPPGFPFETAAKFTLEYHIRVPRNTRIDVNHDVGSLNVDGVTGDISARVLQGEIMLHLPENLAYAIDAKADYGNVNSDFPGERRRSWISQRAQHPAIAPAQKLNLRIGYGDIVLLRIRVPQVAPLPSFTLSSGGSL